MYLNIDYGRCEGCGRCAEAFPRFFEMRDGKAWVINADKFKLDANEAILRVCPYYAINDHDPKPLYYSFCMSAIASSAGSTSPRGRICGK